MSHPAILKNFAPGGLAVIFFVFVMLAGSSVYASTLEDRSAARCVVDLETEHARARRVIAGLTNEVPGGYTELGAAERLFTRYWSKYRSPEIMPALALLRGDGRRAFEGTSPGAVERVLAAADAFAQAGLAVNEREPSTTDADALFAWARLIIDHLRSLRPPSLLPVGLANADAPRMLLGAYWRRHGGAGALPHFDLGPNTLKDAYFKKSERAAAELLTVFGAMRDRVGGPSLEGEVPVALDPFLRKRRSRPSSGAVHPQKVSDTFF